MNSVKVSVCMTAYNHSKYIEKAIRSVLMQKTDFKIEVIVADDASTDETQKIISNIAKEYPDIIKPILREKNLGGTQNSLDAIIKCCGEYIAFLEGDDFWIDENKLQKQVEFLDANKEFLACYHKNQKVDDNNNVIEENDSRFDVVGEFTVKHITEEFLLPGQLGTLMIRKEVVNNIDPQLIKKVMLNVGFIPGDRMVPIYILSMGKIYCMPDVMSAYRWVLKANGQNWSSKYSQDDSISHFVLILTRKNMEKLGKLLNLPIDFEKQEYDSFIDALWKYKFLKKRKYIFNILYMYFFSNHKKYLRKYGVPKLKNEVATRKKNGDILTIKSKIKGSLKERCPKLAMFLKKVKKTLSKN